MGSEHARFLHQMGSDDSDDRGVFVVVSLLPWAGATARARLRVLELIGAAAGLLLHFSVWGWFGSLQRTASRFLEDARGRDCDAALSQLSAAAKEQLETDVPRRSPPNRFRPCGLDEYRSLSSDSTRLVRSDEHSAAVRMVKGVGSGGFLVPGLWTRKIT
jgi:hypothetical protein